MEKSSIDHISISYGSGQNEKVNYNYVVLYGTYASWGYKRMYVCLAFYSYILHPPTIFSFPPVHIFIVKPRESSQREALTDSHCLDVIQSLSSDYIFKLCQCLRLVAVAQRLWQEK